MTYITLIQLSRNLYRLQKCHSITAWPGKSRRALILAKPVTLAAKYLVYHNTVEEDLPASLFTGSRDVLWGDLKDWMAAPAFTTAQLIMSAFVLACQGCIKTYEITRPLEHSHTREHPNTNSDTCLCILTRTLRQTRRDTRSQSDEPSLATKWSSRCYFSIGWSTANKQTNKERRTNKQTSPICFLSCECCTLSDVWLWYVWLPQCMSVCLCVNVAAFFISMLNLYVCVFFLFVSLRARLCIHFVCVHFIHICLCIVCPHCSVCVYALESVCVCLCLCAQWRNWKCDSRAWGCVCAALTADIYVWTDISILKGEL